MPSQDIFTFFGQNVRRNVYAASGPFCAPLKQLYCFRFFVVLPCVKPLQVLSSFRQQLLFSFLTADASKGLRAWVLLGARFAGFS